MRSGRVGFVVKRIAKPHDFLPKVLFENFFKQSAWCMCDGFVTALLTSHESIMKGKHVRGTYGVVQLDTLRNCRSHVNHVTGSAQGPLTGSDLVIDCLTETVYDTKLVWVGGDERRVEERNLEEGNPSTMPRVHSRVQSHAERIRVDLDSLPIRSNRLSVFSKGSISPMQFIQVLRFGLDIIKGSFDW